MRRNTPSIFDDIFNPSFFEEADYAGDRPTMPSVNISETENDFKLEVAAPGMKKEDFNIVVNDNVLTISSEKTREEREEEKFTRREFSYEAFQRRFTLPKTVDEENINASYKDGVLEISIPKKEEAKRKSPRQIDIR
ncbi:MAG: Hsp20/alpha crystallin family protein [Candidatus Cyclobacteriaceae bacterium M2_1C_046]